MRRFKRKKRGENIEERLLSIPTDRAGCEEIGGSWNKKSGQCDIRQLKDKEIPEEIVHKKFDTVKRTAEDTGGTEKVEGG